MNILSDKIKLLEILLYLFLYNKKRVSLSESFVLIDSKTILI